MLRIAIFTCIILLSSCANVCKIESFKVTTGSNIVTFKESEFPCSRKEDFIESAKLTTEAIFSETFENELSNYMKDSIIDGAHKPAWKGLDALTIIKTMRQKLDGTYVETYGGIKGLWLSIIKGNIAYDGTECGPILFNRIPLKNRSITQISNTLAHEIAHRAGLKHPNSNDNLGVAQLEPPYVIGDMIEEIVKNNISN